MVLFSTLHLSFELRWGFHEADAANKAAQNTLQGASIKRQQQQQSPKAEEEAINQAEEAMVEEKLRPQRHQQGIVGYVRRILRTIREAWRGVLDTINAKASNGVQATPTSRMCSRFCLPMHTRVSIPEMIEGLTVLTPAPHLRTNHPTAHGVFATERFRPRSPTLQTLFPRLRSNNQPDSHGGNLDNNGNRLRKGCTYTGAAKASARVLAGPVLGTPAEGLEYSVQPSANTLPKRSVRRTERRAFGRLELGFLLLVSTFERETPAWRLGRLFWRCRRRRSPLETPQGDHKGYSDGDSG